MVLTCPIIHPGLMTPDEDGEWLCRECRRRLYWIDDQVVEADPTDMAPDWPLSEITVSQVDPWDLAT